MKRKSLVRRSLIGFLLVLTLLWLWREAMGLAASVDGMIACLGLPMALVLLVIPNDRTSTDGSKGVGLGYAMLMVGWSIILLISLTSRMNQTSYRGAELHPLPGRLIFCFMSWAILFLALMLISSLEGQDRQDTERPASDQSSPPNMP